MDESLRQYATDAQWECYKALCQYGSSRKAAAQIGKHHSLISRQVAALKAKAARAGHSPEHDMTHPVPPGYMVKGTSTLYGDDGSIRAQWVKSHIDPAQQEALLRAAAEAFASDLPKASPVKAPAKSADHLLVAYPVGDHHFGMYAWHQDAGGDFDLDIAERLLCGAFDYLVSAAPPAGEGVIIFLGDQLHYDNLEALTPSNKHLLDSDDRFPKIVEVAVRSIRYAVNRALRRHQRVRLVLAGGNHDPASTVWLRVCFNQFYSDDPRVTVDTSPSLFHYVEFGRCLIGVHHGHTTKMQALPGVMAADQPEAWGRTRYRYWYTGHVHHDAAKDYPGVRCESFRILPPTDAYAQSHGYRSERDMKAIILHRDHGEQGRIITTPEMLSAA